MTEYAREHGSSNTEVRGDGSVAHFSDPTQGMAAEAPAQTPEHGTEVLDQPVGDEDAPEGDEAPEGLKGGKK